MKRILFLAFAVILGVQVSAQVQVDSIVDPATFPELSIVSDANARLLSKNGGTWNLVLPSSLQSDVENGWGVVSPDSTGNITWLGRFKRNNADQKLYFTDFEGDRVLIHDPAAIDASLNTLSISNDTLTYTQNNGSTGFIVLPSGGGGGGGSVWDENTDTLATNDKYVRIGYPDNTAAASLSVQSYATTDWSGYFTHPGTGNDIRHSAFVNPDWSGDAQKYAYIAYGSDPENADRHARFNWLENNGILKRVTFGNGANEFKFSIYTLGSNEGVIQFHNYNNAANYTDDVLGLTEQSYVLVPATNGMIVAKPISELPSGGGGGGSDNLGNHTATQVLVMDGNNIQGVGRVNFDDTDGDTALWYIEENTDGTLIFRNATSGDPDLQINEDGSLRIGNAYTLPTVDGSSGQVLKTDGSGNVTWQDDNMTIGGGGGSLPTGENNQILVAGANGTFYAEDQSQPLQLNQIQGVDCHCGDSNTNGRPDNRGAYEEIMYCPTCPRNGYISYNNGQNGSTAQGWFSSINNASMMDSVLHDFGVAPYDYDPGANLWRFVNGDSSGVKCNTIYISLLTNDVNNFASRNNVGGIGQYARMNFHLDTIVNFLLERTTANLVLRTPAPLAWQVEGDQFEAFVGFVDADEAAATNDTIRMIYDEWIYEHPHPRVQVLQTHKLFGGSRIDSAEVAPLATWSHVDLPLIDDVLHTNKAGYMEMWWAIRHMLHGDFPHPERPIYEIDEQIIEEAAYSRFLYLRGRSSSSVAFELDPMASFFGRDSEYSVQNGNYDQLMMSEFSTLASFNAINQELTEILNNEPDTLYVYSLIDRQTYRIWGPVFTSQVVTNTPTAPPYVTFGYLEGDDFSACPIGPVILYHKERSAVPFAGGLWSDGGTFIQYNDGADTEVRVGNPTVRNGSFNAGSNTSSKAAIYGQNTSGSFRLIGDFAATGLGAGQTGYLRLGYSTTTATASEWRFTARTSGNTDAKTSLAILGIGNIFTASENGAIRFDDYSAGNLEPTDLTKTVSDFVPVFATDGTILEAREKRGSETGTTDGSGDFTITHNLGAPTHDIDIDFVSTPYTWAIQSESTTSVTIRLYIPDASGGYSAAASAAYSIEYTVRGINE